MYSAGHSPCYLGVWKEFTTFAMLPIILLIMTIVNACMCAYNFNKGLKPYLMPRKLESMEEKGRYSASTKLGQGSGDESITID